MKTTTPIKYVIFDIDGTLADSRHRSHHIRIGVGTELTDNHGDKCVVVEIKENHEDYPGETAYRLEYRTDMLDVYSLWWGYSSVEKWREVDWAAWEADTSEDTLIVPTAMILNGMRVIQAMAANEGCELRYLFLTGRGDTCADQTFDWLTEHDLFDPTRDELVMRDRSDTRPDTEIKREVIRKLKADGHEILCAFEDRRLVAKMMREEGIFVFHVADYD